MPGFVWHMPPPTMIIGSDMTPSKLCNNWLNPRLNSFLAQRGGRDDMKTFKKEFEHHVSDDPLVRWAWNPGPGRTPAPGTHAQFAKAMSVWIGLTAAHLARQKVKLKKSLPKMNSPRFKRAV